VESVRFCLAEMDEKKTKQEEEEQEPDMVVIQFTFTRDLTGSFLTNFLPFIICIVIGHTTVYIKSFKISASMNLTLLLVLVTL
jgi:hypothetical protein